MSDYNGFYPDKRYWYDERTAKPPSKSNMEALYHWVTNTRNYTSNTKQRFLPYCSPQYQYPIFYFWAVKDKLRILGTKTELHMNGKWNDQQLAAAQSILGPSWTREALHAVYSFLRVQKLPSYYKALLSFKWYTGLLSFPLFDQYDCISLIGGKPFVACSLLQYGFKPINGFETYIPLTKNFVEAEIKRFNGTSQINDKIAAALAKHLTKLHQQDTYFNLTMEPMTASYREGILTYIPALGCAEYRSANTPFFHYFPSLGPLPQNVGFSDELENTLLTLTGGDLDKLDLLAEFFARIFCNTVPSKYLWYIHGRSQQFLAWLLNHTGVRADYTLYQPGNHQQALIVNGYYLNAPIQINRYSLPVDDIAHLSHSTLKKYINGGNIIKTNDPYQLNKLFEYYPTVIYSRSGDWINKEDTFKNLPWREISIPDEWTAGNLTEEDYQWLKTCFVARGLQIINEPSGAEQPELKQIVQQFTESFCEEDPSSYIDGKGLYDALVEYTDTLPYTVKLPGSTVLLGSVEQWIDRKRTEYRANNNRKSFVGIRLNRDKLDVALAENKSRRATDRQARAAQTFHGYLTQITSLVLWPS